MLAGWVLVASGLFDTLDGCVAVLEKRTTKWGYVLDSAVDRLNDVIYLAAVVSVGARWSWRSPAASCSSSWSTSGPGRQRRRRRGRAHHDRRTAEPGDLPVGVHPLRRGLPGPPELVATTGLAVMTLLSVIGVGSCSSRAPAAAGAPAGRAGRTVPSEG
jgi:CDP-diacylglycerol--glycerol-3-phosphate 3-phosphatidyltransferase